MDKVNSISIDRDNYNSEEEFEKKLGKLINCLLGTGQIVTIRYEDCGIYAVEFNPADQNLCMDYPYWLSPDERESVIEDDNNIKIVVE